MNAQSYRSCPLALGGHRLVGNSTTEQLADLIALSPLSGSVTRELA